MHREQESQPMRTKWVAATCLACMEARRGRRCPQSSRIVCGIMGGCPRTGSKLERRRQALLLHWRREGLFHPVGNMLDKSKLMIYRYSSQSCGGDCTPPSSLGWDGLVVPAVLSLGGGSVPVLTHPWLISIGE